MSVHDFRAFLLDQAETMMELPCAVNKAKLEVLMDIERNVSEATNGA